MNVKASGAWSEKVYDKTIANLNDSSLEKLNIRIDGPYGSSSNEILNSKNIILIAAGTGIAKFASILQDIAFKIKDNVVKSDLESVHFIWLCDDSFYVEWFKNYCESLIKNMNRLILTMIFILRKEMQLLYQKTCFIFLKILLITSTILTY